MPEKFNACIREGGKVVRIKPRKNVFLNVCYPKGGGKAVAGETHHMESECENEIKLIMDSIVGEESTTANIAKGPEVAIGQVNRRPMPKDGAVNIKVVKRKKKEKKGGSNLDKYNKEVQSQFSTT